MKLAKKHCLQILVGILSYAPGFVHSESQQIVLESSLGENYVIEVQPDDSFNEVLSLINQSLAIVELQSDESQGCATSYPGSYLASNGFNMSISKDNAINVKSVPKKLTSTRNYNAGFSTQEKNDISYIVKTLANSSLLKIKGAESNLKKAGDRVENVHPLQFLMVIFTSEELKACMLNLEGRTWVWKGFLDGIMGSLSQENAIGNVLPFVADFAQKLGIDQNTILPTLQAGQWEKFVETLIKVVPRQGNSGRYDM